MGQLLLEIFSEEIPARMQAGAARDLERLMRERLADAGLEPEALRAFAGPRRLALAVDGLPAATPDVAEERKGPRVGAPDAAVEGFLRSTGLKRADLVERDGVYFATLSRKGRPTPEIIAAAVEATVRDFPWPKSMRWGTGTLRWIRPIQRILCVFDGEVVPFAIDGIESGDVTEGHRFMGSGKPFKARTLAAYERALADHFVVLDARDRKERIVDGARDACAKAKVELIGDDGLLDEVSGLAEWPTPVLGDMDPAFLDLPAEVIRTSMRTHQKYFAVRDPKTGKLAPHFVTVANIEAPDGGEAIAAGNARVLSARLNDARFFWDEDRKPGNFDRWLDKLAGVTFHAKLGTMAERVERITALAREIAPLVGADPDVAAEAARLCKADLASGMVSEFPELQGVMGRYYALEPFPLDGGRVGMGVTAAGDDSPAGAASGNTSTPNPGPSPIKGEGRRFTADERVQIADAIRDHYKPQGPSDEVPSAQVSVAVALADKLDTLVGFFAIDEKPTGSRDPYGLRRAALGVIRTLLQSQARLSATKLAWSAVLLVLDQALARDWPVQRDQMLVVSARFGAFGSTLEFEDTVARARAGRELVIELEKYLTPLIDSPIFYNLDTMSIVGGAADNARRAVELSSEAEVAYALESLVQLTLAPYSGAQKLLLERGRSRSVDEFGSGLLKPEMESWAENIVELLLFFFADRLKVLLRDQGKRHDLVDAVFALGDDDLVRIVARVEALESFLSTDDGANLLAGYKRASNILNAEAKKGPLPEGYWNDAYEHDVEEVRLFQALTAAEQKLEALLQEERFNAAMAELSKLREPVDAFFERVLVNADDPEVRANRLRLLGNVRNAMNRVADFSKIAG